ncbi:alpha-D-glucose phosphate-specific phosphoglucomutase [Bartonella sp. DGB2]|uniref:alpha-D-glucose phosphate-specific phosphoglucomutase n=1 Tax=Bartonella sp. DGB2 TaxID=3388426 RepID=UPI0039902710
MTIKLVKTTPFYDQNPGTSGLRKKVTSFQSPHYLENFIQAIFDSCGSIKDQLLILGGDGRTYSREAIQIIAKMAAANGFGRLKIARHGLLSTPAASHLIRKYGAHSGIILSASHNPGGPRGDFGIKYNIDNGGPAPEKVTQAIFERTKNLTHYKTLEASAINIDQLGQTCLGSMAVEIIDPVKDYADLMESLFDFDQIRTAIKRGLTFAFDAMHAVTGPYAEEIFLNRLGFPKESILRALPLEDFGGHPPDPNPTHAHSLYAMMMHPQAPDLGAASDGDGDRNLILGREQFVSPSDSLAIIAANAAFIKAYATGFNGIARSMPTSQAIERVAQKQGVSVFETPTGWKFFGNLMDHGLVDLCGEESFAQGGNHIREKDGLWAILFWLNLLAVRKISVKAIVKDHWRTYGRTYYSRHDYEGIDNTAAEAIINHLRAQLPNLKGQILLGFKVEEADDFCYHDVTDGSQSPHQGIRILFSQGARIVYRLSGTGTKGATLRIYLERFESDPNAQEKETQNVLEPLILLAQEWAALPYYLGRTDADVII